MTNTLNYYNQNADEISSRYEEADVFDLWQIFAKAFKPGQKILEIGCGSGRDGAYLHKLGCDVHAIDGSTELCRKAVEFHPELEGKIKCHCLPKTLPFIKNEFDAVISIACLMHMQVSDIEAVLADISRILKEQGLIIISVPVQRGDVSDTELDCCGRQFTLLSTNQWKLILDNSGFNFIATKITPDGLGREQVKWATFVFENHK